MKICKNRSEIFDVITHLKFKNKTIGFVPTMGALHDGHLSLVMKSKQENDITIVSIFVNPIQFNNPDDLKKYPRTIDADFKLLRDVECDVVFVPEVEDMYPEGQNNTESYDFGALESVMEGAHRPGHFNGVAIVVKRLFDLVPANKAYFGLKDFQQLAIVQQLVSQLKIPITIVPCDIVREKDGLAMSSRNVRLTQEQRKQSVSISKALFMAKEQVAAKTIEEVKKVVVDIINDVPLLKIEYFDIVDAVSLQPVNSWDNTKSIVGCIAVNVGDVRLIDNIILKNS